MSKLMSGAALALILAVPATAQDAPADQVPGGDAVVGEPAEPGTQSGEAVTSDDQDDDDDDDDDDDGAAAPAGDDGGVHEAQGKFDYGFSGLLARDNRTDLAPLTLASGQPVASAEYTIKSGGYYRIEITADGSQELSLSGGDFFRAIWINEIVIEDIEIRPMGVHSIEFDSAGTARLSFIAVLPGRYTLSVPGSSGDTMQAVFNIQ
ncbi:hypothetical protein D3P06_08405 [Paracoccus aestuarii]|uniref:Copper-binding protein n=1 Tax=Paracoccus aestuarii TaxID=453842 RepID=A0A418ZX49_9RHOB|nr:hypothetical protein D3P06_08405 [Paracoccus aestuarii]WCR00561.1 hypothetical protein JHW48_00075 [Paracoccus aestuarii]